MICLALALVSALLQAGEGMVHFPHMALVPADSFGKI